jgi:hypothetical protein
VGFAQPDELRGIFEGQGAEQDGVYDAEDRGIGADAEGKGKDGDDGEAGRFCEHAQGKSEVLY